MRIYDISATICHDTPAYPGQPKAELTYLKSIAEGGSSNVSCLTMTVHTGTHVDAPVHFIPGAAGAEALDLSVLIGPALVVHALQADIIDAHTLESLSIPLGTERLLIRTRNSALWASDAAAMEKGFVAINADGARWLVARGVRLIGVDGLSVAPMKQGREPHEVLLQAGVTIVEELDLGQVPPGEYQLFCLPLKLEGSDAGPARAILLGA